MQWQLLSLRSSYLGWMVGTAYVMNINDAGLLFPRRRSISGGVQIFLAVEWISCDGVKIFLSGFMDFSFSFIFTESILPVFSTRNNFFGFHFLFSAGGCETVETMIFGV